MSEQDHKKYYHYPAPRTEKFTVPYDSEGRVSFDTSDKQRIEESIEVTSDLRDASVVSLKLSGISDAIENVELPSPSAVRYIIMEMDMTDGES